MIVKRKLFSFIDEDGNQGYYLYNESTGEEKLFAAPAIGASINKAAAMYGKSLNRAIIGSKQQIERVSSKAIGNPSRKRMIDKAITSRAQSLSRVSGGEISPSAMNYILRR